MKLLSNFMLDTKSFVLKQKQGWGRGEQLGHSIQIKPSTNTVGPNRSGDDMEAWWIGGAAGVEWLNVSTPGRRHSGSKSWRREGAMDQNRDGSERWRHGGVLDLDASR
jgi:hypothetical protein